MKLFFINENIFEPQKSPVQREEFSYIKYRKMSERTKKLVAPCPIRITGRRLRTWPYVNKICKRWERTTTMSSPRG